MSKGIEELDKILFNLIAEAIAIGESLEWQSSDYDTKLNAIDKLRDKYRPHFQNRKAE